MASHDETSARPAGPPWFADVRVHSLRGGLELQGDAELARAKDPWLYYLCSARPASDRGTIARSQQ